MIYRNKKIILFISIIVISLLLRLLVSLLGTNYDYDSYEIVATIVNNGKNVYRETIRYNYGPIWFLTLSFIKKISLVFPSPRSYATLITLFLSIIDISIGIILYKKFGLKSAILFLLNPVSIYISGFHRQFDNFAILLGIVSALILSDEEKKYSAKHIVSLFLLGLSLATKHILFAFPIWLALRNKKILLRLADLCIPWLIFALSFIPYWNQGKEGILTNIFGYHSAINAPFWHLMGYTPFTRIFSPVMLWIGALLISGFIIRKQKLMYGFGLYLILLVIFSTAVVNQYWAIVVLYISLFPNVFFYIFYLFYSFSIVSVHRFSLGNMNTLIHIPDYSLFENNQLFVLIGFMGLLYNWKNTAVMNWKHHREVFFILLFSGSIFILFLLPHYYENYLVFRIQEAINKQQYELANKQYDETQKKPAVFGTRFYDKLNRVRSDIQFYRRLKEIEYIIKTDNKGNYDSLKMEIENTIPIDFKSSSLVYDLLWKLENP